MSCCRSHVIWPGSGEDTLCAESPQRTQSVFVQKGLYRLYFLVLVSDLPESVDSYVMSVVGCVPGQFDDAEEYM